MILSVGTNGKLVIDPLPVEHDHVAARRDLAGNPLEIVAGAVHEVEAGLVDRMGVVDHVVDARPRILLMHRAERLERDVVETAQLVAAGRIAFGRHTVPRQPLGEGGDVPQHRAGRLEVARVPHHEGFAASDLVGLAEHAGAAVANQLVHDGASERIAGDAGEGVGAAALERDSESRQRRLRSAGGRRLGHEAPHDGLRLGQPRREPRPHAQERVRHLSQCVLVLLHERAQTGVGDRLDAEINGDDRADVGVDHEAGERAQHLGGVVRLAGPAALRVRDGDDAVD